MKFALPLLTLALALQPATGQLLGRGCGFKIAPCPPDMTCKPDSDDCTNLDRCPGYCTWRNVYPSCGGFRLPPVPPVPDCKASEVCRDDPRDPDSCGMACDAPGICLPRVLPRCNLRTRLGCPRGKFCYKRPTQGVGWFVPEQEGTVERRDKTEAESFPWLGICL